MTTSLSPYSFSPSAPGTAERARRGTDEHTIAPSEIAVGVTIGALPSISTLFAIASVLVFLAVFFPFADPAGQRCCRLWCFICIFGRPIGTLVHVV
jgi:hypothetical protein